MPLTSSTQFGQHYDFGFLSSDAPTISNFVARSADVKWEAETFQTATDGEGVTDSVTTTLANKRKVTATFTGYSIGFTGANISISFSWRGRFFIVKSIGEPRKKGEYVEVSLECESYANVNS